MHISRHHPWPAGGPDVELDPVPGLCDHRAGGSHGGGDLCQRLSAGHGRPGHAACSPCTGMEVSVSYWPRFIVAEFPDPASYPAAQHRRHLDQGLRAHRHHHCAAVHAHHPENLLGAGPCHRQCHNMLLAISTAGVFFSLFGFTQAIQLAGETDNPARNIPHLRHRYHCHRRHRLRAGAVRLRDSGAAGAAGEGWLGGP